MKLREVAEVQSDTFDPVGNDEPKEIDPAEELIGTIIEYSPEVVEDKKGRTQHILTLHSIVEGHTGHKSYRLESVDPIRIKILSKSHHEDDRVFKARFLTNPDRLLTRYSMAHEDFTPNPDGEPITFKLKDVPDIESYDHMTDGEFYKEFGRKRLDTDRGLIGHVLIEQDEAPDLMSDELAGDPGHDDPSAGYSNVDSHKSKLDQAIAIYRSNRGKPRKYVVRLIKDRLDMSQAGGSSYYTKAMHAVEED